MRSGKAMRRTPRVSGFPREKPASQCCSYGGFQQVPPNKFCFMMLFLCGFPSGSFEKIQFHDVVLTRISGKFWCGDGTVVRSD